jgi:hypothetical protein
LLPFTLSWSNVTTLKQLMRDKEEVMGHRHAMERKTLRQAFAVARAMDYEVPEWMEELLLEVLTEGGKVKRREINRIHDRIMEMVTKTGANGKASRTTRKGSC